MKVEQNNAEEFSSQESIDGFDTNPQAVSEIGYPPAVPL